MNMDATGCSALRDRPARELILPIRGSPFLGANFIRRASVETCPSYAEKLLARRMV